MDVDWSKTNQGRKYYNRQSAVDFAAAGISHVRIRIADKVDQELLEGLDRQIRDCLDNGIIPIIAYQADAFKNDPSDKNIENVVTWWSEVAEHYQDKSLIPSPATIKCRAANIILITINAIPYNTFFHCIFNFIRALLSYLSR